MSSDIALSLCPHSIEVFLSVQRDAGFGVFGSFTAVVHFLGVQERRHPLILFHYIWSKHEYRFLLAFASSVSPRGVLS